MAIDLHTISMSSASSQLAQSDRLVLGIIKQLANAAGSGAGAAVTIPVAMSLPASYTVQVTPSQDATVWITNRTQAGFTINMAPRLAANTLAAGAVDVVVMA